MKYLSRFFNPPPRETGMSPAVFLLLLTLVFAVSAGARWRQYETWKSKPDLYFSDGVPMMSTTDAYYWLRWARESLEGTFKAYEPDPLRGHALPAAYPNLPAISSLIAAVSRATGTDIARAGHGVVIFLSGLFALPLGFYFYRAGYPACGLVGGFIGALNPEYFYRTSVGRVDTDCLNLFFFCAISLAVLLSADRNAVKAVLWAALAGWLCHLFKFWYDHYFFISAYFVALAVFLLLSRIRLPVVAACLAAFALPFHRINVIASFQTARDILATRIFPHAPEAVSGSAGAAQAALPDIIATITETESLGYRQTLASVMKPEWFAAASLLLCLILALRRFKIFVPLLPCLFIGILSLLKARRFAMYLAPFLGIGIGFALTAASDFIAGYRDKKPSLKSLWNRMPGPARKSVQPLLIALACALLTPADALTYVPAPTVPADIYADFKKLDGILPREASVFNFWNFGYAIMEVARRKIYHDGGTLDPSITYLVARAYASPSQDELHRVFSYLNARGIDGVRALAEKLPDFDRVIGEIAKGAPSDPASVHVAFTRNMIRQYESMYELGTWNFRTGGGKKSGYRQIACNGLKNGVLSCMGGDVDLNRGTVNGKPKLARAFVIGKSGILLAREYGNPGETIEVILKDKLILSTIMIDEAVYNSNFNQMYLLGRYDENLFTLDYDNFPSTRVLGLKPRSRHSKNAAVTFFASPSRM